MYTGTLIRDLTATVERAEFRVKRQQALADEMELERLFDLHAPLLQSEHIYAGAA